jgi:hypothetical protein
MTNKCTIISQIITLLHISILLCHPQGIHSLYLPTKIPWAEIRLCLLRASKCCFILYNKPTHEQLFHKLSHSYMFRHYCVILREFIVCTFPLKYPGLRCSCVFCVRVNVVLFCTINQQMHNCHKLSHSYMFRNYCVILREFIVCTFPLKYPGLRCGCVFCVQVNVVLFFTINQHMHNHIITYITHKR